LKTRRSVAFASANDSAVSKRLLSERRSGSRPGRSDGESRRSESDARPKNLNARSARNSPSGQLASRQRHSVAKS